MTHFFLKKNFFTVLEVETKALGILGMCPDTQPHVAFLVLNEVSLHCPGWLWMYSLAQAGLKLSMFLPPEHPEQLKGQP